VKILVTGAAGFIGSAVAARLLARGEEVVGLDNLNAYYDPDLKRARLALLQSRTCFRFVEQDLAAASQMQNLFAAERFDRVVHLAAQAGVRHSLVDPQAYVDSNITGTLNILEACRHYPVQHLVFASTSSVYGANAKLPFSVHDGVGHPLSLYAATKRANELMAHTYATNFGLAVTGLRFFTVYGPWGRPDMALFLFTRNILAGRPIDVFNHGHHRRDFTYIDDVVEGLVRVLDHPPRANLGWQADDPDPATSQAPFRLYNIGNGQSVELARYIETLERCLGRRAERNLLPMQPGDIADTAADVTDLVRDVGYRPSTSVEEGVARFVLWYREYYAV